MGMTSQQAIIKRLRQHAERRMVADVSASLDMEDSEDLELLGARSSMVKPAVLADLDAFFQQIPTPPGVAAAEPQGFLFEFAGSDQNELEEMAPLSMETLFGTGEEQLQMVDDVDVRAVSYLWVSHLRTDGPVAIMLRTDMKSARQA
jgi:hypothetical protein